MPLTSGVARPHQARSRARDGHAGPFTEIGRTANSVLACLPARKPIAVPAAPRRLAAMFEAITRLFNKPETALSSNDPKLSVAVLLVHLAAVDGQMKDEERNAIKGALIDHYDMDETSVDKLIKEAALRDAEAVDFFKFTQSITQLEMEDRIEIIRMMWMVVFADKKNHELEDNMVWRIAELIGVSSRDRTILRNQVGKAV
jgi:uncharacterized tellurite resistance protein B-like protein